MRRSSCNSAWLPARRIQTWQLMRLPGWLSVTVLTVVTADLAAIGLAARYSPVHLADVVLFTVLVLCGAIAVELLRRCGEMALFAKDVSVVWELPMVILLPPVYAMLAPIPRMLLTQWRVRKSAPHRRVYTAAVYGLSYGAAYLTFHAAGRITTLSLTGTRPQAAAWIAAVAVCVLVQWLVNSGLIFVAIKGSDPTVTLRGTVLARDNLQNDVMEGSVGSLVALAITVTPLTIVLALPFVTLLQRSSRHAQLINESRIDSKTGLLNAGTWRRESSSEVSRAQRTGSPLALALIDIDFFKAVNDRYGHLAGDEVLAAVGRALRGLVRDYDLIGRFGGEEFALLLPQTDEAGARILTERIRSQVAGLQIEAPGGPGTDPISLTVSIGVVTVAAAGDLTEMLAVADAALYRAKHAGRNRVWVTTETESLSLAGAVDPLGTDRDQAA
ncbi:MAG TPA: GGDEF domain-containing protein [Streptosporangiaceae bacterium]